MRVSFELLGTLDGRLRWPCSAVIFAALALSTLCFEGHEVRLLATPENSPEVKLSFHELGNSLSEHLELNLHQDLVWDAHGEQTCDTVPDSLRTFLSQNIPT